MICTRAHTCSHTHRLREKIFLNKPRFSLILSQSDASLEGNSATHSCPRCCPASALPSVRAGVPLKSPLAVSPSASCPAAPGVSGADLTAVCPPEPWLVVTPPALPARSGCSQPSCSESCPVECRSGWGDKSAFRHPWGPALRSLPREL